MRDVDQIVESIRNICPEVKVQQLKVPHPGADDDGLWFFTQPNSEFEVQIESPKGMCPFLIETDENDVRITADSIQKAVETVAKLLYLEPKV